MSSTGPAQSAPHSPISPHATARNPHDHAPRAAVNAALNIVCLRLLKRHRGEDVNFKASAIFTSNDSIVNLAIVLSGALVIWWGSNLPDVVLGLVVAAIAANGGREILAEAREAAERADAKKA